MEKPGSGRLRVERLSLAANRILLDADDDSDSWQKVDVTSIDVEVFSRKVPPPRILKIDVEGAEALCVQGMSQVIRDFHPTILVEIHGASQAGDVFRMLWENHYVLWKIPYMRGTIQRVTAAAQIPPSYLEGFVLSYHESEADSVEGVLSYGE